MLLLRTEDDRYHLLFASDIPFLPFAPIKSSEIATELKRAQIPNVVLNACNSAKARVPHHANLAQKLIESCVDAVVAMSYAVLAQSAEVFIRDFYQNFLAS